MSSSDGKTTQLQPIPIEQFLSEDVVLVDTFIRLGSGKFVLIAKGGQSTASTNLEKYKDRNLEALYVRIDDYHRFLTQQASNAQAVIKNPANLKASSRAAVLQDAMKAVYREMSELGFNDDVYSHAKLVNHALMSFLKDNSAMTDLIERFGTQSGDGVAHSMMVSMVSVMIGMKHEWVRPATLEKLSLGGFLHDLGSAKLPLEILNKKESQLTRDERIIFESHVDIGAQFLINARTVPDDVVLMVSEHHERSDGSGFPKKLKDVHISPLARIVALANAFVDRVSEESKPLSAIAAYRVFEEFRVQRAGQFNRDAIKALEKCLDVKAGSRAAG